MLSRVVTGIFDEELMPVGIKASQLNALITVARMGPSPPTAICRALQMDESTASRNLQRMRQKGWLTCGTGADRRTRVVALTPEGKAMLERAFPAWERAQKRASELLGPDGVAALDQMSKKIRALSM